MKFLIADDELSAIDSLSKSLKKILGNDAVISAVRNGHEAVLALEKEKFDVLFLDIEMPGMDGMTVARRVKERWPQTNIVMVTAYQQHAIDAWGLHVSDYLLKPASEADVRDTLEHLRYPVENKKLLVRCFGDFDVSCQGRKIVFALSKAKEMFAYLVFLRGASANVEDLCAVLWENDKQSINGRAYVRSYHQEIRKALAKTGMEDVIRHTRNDYSVDTDYLDCDYYRYLNGEKDVLRFWHGEFMRQYSWAEHISGLLGSRIEMK